MITQHCITSREVQQLVQTQKSKYKGFSNPSFSKETGIPFKTEEEYTEFLFNLTEVKDIINFILKPMSEMKIFVLEDFREGDEIFYVIGSKEIDITKIYQGLHQIR